MRVRFLISAAVLAALVPHLVFADWCYSNAPYRDLDDLQAYIWKVATYNGVEHRKTEQELATASEPAEEIHAKYAATGTIKCGSFRGTAQVTVKHNVITTAAHVLWNENTCQPIAKPSSCKFILTDVKGVEHPMNVSRALGDGFKCPRKPGQKINNEDDWAILKLEGNGATEVDPYLVPGLPGENLTVGSKVTFVGHSADFQRKDAQGKRIFPKHIQRGCMIKNVDGGFDPNFYWHNCAASGMSSGGSLLSENSGHLLLAGIYKGNSESEAQMKSEEETGTPANGDYSDLNWKGSAVAVRGDFLKKILEVTKEH